MVPGHADGRPPEGCCGSTKSASIRTVSRNLQARYDGFFIRELGRSAPDFTWGTFSEVSRHLLTGSDTIAVSTG